MIKYIPMCSNERFIMLKKLLILVTICLAVTSCASWFSSSQEIPDSPTVGGKQDSSDMLFGQAESVSPAPTSVPSATSTSVPAIAPTTIPSSIK